MRLTAFEPDQPGNLGALVRVAACFDMALDVIEPCGFPLSDKALRRAAMDYAEHVAVTRHIAWERYVADRAPGRLILLSTRGAESIHDHIFAADDHLILGRESAGAPEHVHEAADAVVRVPISKHARSLNIAVAAAIAAAEARRQLGW